ncbi:MAG: TraR/DksA C4-type zinc finger protein [Candidatus Dadabacteria bacterium]|nr:TraR/DksA C4-type zinc finger protein [Candidatus Dadabacteria bacterium]MCY4263128.1 TraR/DksA C4-type zinc finger protein [Candidatus Dadabacteria bacterium]
MPRVKKEKPGKKPSKKNSSAATGAKTRSRKANPKKYTKKFLNQMTTMLKEMRKDLLEDVTRSMKEESDHLRFNVGDFYDHASENRQRELALTLSNRERSKLLQIDDALKRIESGEYGFCEVTGEKIGEERLFALPFTTLSVEAQEEIERGDY